MAEWCYRVCSSPAPMPTFARTTQTCTLNTASLQSIPFCYRSTACSIQSVHCDHVWDFIPDTSAIVLSLLTYLSIEDLSCPAVICLYLVGEKKRISWKNVWTHSHTHFIDILHAMSKLYLVYFGLQTHFWLVAFVELWTFEYFFLFWTLFSNNNTQGNLFLWRWWLWISPTPML